VCAVTIPVLVAVVLGERPGLFATSGIVLGIVSILLVSQPPAGDLTRASSDAGTRRRGLGTALASGVAIGLFLLSLAQTRTEAGMWPLLVSRATTLALFGAIALATRQSLAIAPRVRLLAIAGGGMDMVANILYLVAVRQGPMSVVVTLASLYPASTVILARVLLAERLGTLQVSGVVCALAAVVLIVSGS
jgi:drug/metabolite transporter (DMT)-like permease